MSAKESVESCRLCEARTREERLALVQEWLSLYGIDFVAEVFCAYRKAQQEKKND